jgi:hypothetical protein
VKTSSTQANSVADQLRTRLTDAESPASVLVRADDGRSAMLLMVLDVDGATGTAADDLADKRIPAVSMRLRPLPAHPQLTIEQMGDASINHDQRHRRQGLPARRDPQLPTSASC